MLEASPPSLKRDCRGAARRRIAPSSAFRPSRAGRGAASSARRGTARSTPRRIAGPAFDTTLVRPRSWLAISETPGIVRPNLGQGRTLRRDNGAERRPHFCCASAARKRAQDLAKLRADRPASQRFPAGCRGAHLAAHIGVTHLAEGETPLHSLVSAAMPAHCITRWMKRRI